MHFCWLAPTIGTGRHPHKKHIRQDTKASNFIELNKYWKSRNPILKLKLPILPSFARVRSKVIATIMTQHYHGKVSAHLEPRMLLITLPEQPCGRKQAKHRTSKIREPLINEKFFEHLNVHTDNEIWLSCHSLHAIHSVLKKKRHMFYFLMDFRS